MIVEYIRYKVAEDQAATLVASYTTAAESLRASTHCLGYELARCAEAKDTFVLRILWDSSEGHLQGFRKSAEFGPFLQAIRPFIENIEEMRHYEVTPVSWTR